MMTQGDGDCFVKAVEEAMAADGELLIVHGLVVVPDDAPLLAGLVHTHAWNERTVTRKVPYADSQAEGGFAFYEVTQEYCYDMSNGHEAGDVPLELYYKLGQVRRDSVRRYTVDEALRLMRDCGHYGPWDEALWI